MKVLIASPLHSYVNAREVDAAGTTLREMLADLDRRYPGIRFRMVDEQDLLRKHMRFFVNGEQVFDVEHALRPTDEVQIVQALSGG
ncbi:MAG: MoaD/ThiS family protein [Alphaproteobacteria bacterium]|nr:MoaD/ThiS family protein [Alphaproteobacteria bacterium]MDE2109938.1 MoaD/ThiS family protein [Alphaproteobacteria bacterium]MDE2496091.1 MoaD/ThiS family protein [Alphaproteobacteria bacterium]